MKPRLTRGLWALNAGDAATIIFRHQDPSGIERRSQLRSSASTHVPELKGTLRTLLHKLGLAEDEE